MIKKTEKLFKGIIFIFFMIFIFFIIPGVAGSSEKSFNIPIYIETSAGIERANFETLTHILQNYNFEIKKMSEYVLDEKCSLRGKAGSLEIDGMTFEKNDLSFNIPLKNDGMGQGSLTSQKDRERFSLKFDVEEILKTSPEILVFRASGRGTLNKQELNFNSIIVSFDKTREEVEINGSGDKNFNVKGLKVNFVKWCSGQEMDFYLIIKKDLLKNPLTQEEVDALLKQHPELIDAYERLRNLDPAVVIIPEFGFYVAILTVLSAIGIFFIVRKE